MGEEALASSVCAFGAVVDGGHVWCFMVLPQVSVVKYFFISNGESVT
jgi:hypothetical protein